MKLKKKAPRISYKPVKNRQLSEKERGFLACKLIEGSSDDFLKSMSVLKKEGIKIRSIETKPLKYQYKIWYMETDRTKQDLNEEEWRDIPGVFYGRYQVSSYGRMRTIKVLTDYHGASQVLIDGEGNRYTFQVKNIYKEIFGKELERPDNIQYKQRKFKK